MSISVSGEMRHCFAQAVVNETVDDEATRAELLAAMASTESVRDLLGASLAAKDQQLSSLQGVLQVLGAQTTASATAAKPGSPFRSAVATWMPSLERLTQSAVRRAAGLPEDGRTAHASAVRAPVQTVLIAGHTLVPSTCRRSETATTA